MTQPFTPQQPDPQAGPPLLNPIPSLGAPYISPLKLDYYWSQLRVPGFFISASQCQPVRLAPRNGDNDQGGGHGMPSPFFHIPPNCERAFLLPALKLQAVSGLAGLFTLILECEKKGELEALGRGGFWERIAGSSLCDDDDYDDNSSSNSNSNNENRTFREARAQRKKKYWIPPSGRKMRAYETAMLALEIRFARKQFLRWTRGDDSQRAPSGLERLVDEFSGVWGAWEERWDDDDDDDDARSNSAWKVRRILKAMLPEGL